MSAVRFSPAMSRSFSFPSPFPILNFLRQAGRAAAAALCLAAMPSAAGPESIQTAAGLTGDQIAGRALVEKILARWPAQNFTNTGTLQIRDGSGHRSSVAVACETQVTGTNWLNRYIATPEAASNGPAIFVAVHSGTEPNAYAFSGAEAAAAPPAASRIAAPFAGSDFWLCDLGLDFFHWPGQKVVKKEFHRQCPCTVLESTNPHPRPGLYSRVVCWIDNDSLGIVEAYAYDYDGRQLKNFYPKKLEKVNGEYQVGSMVMENLQTDSKSVLEFEPGK